MTDETAFLVRDIVERVMPLLAGHGPDVQGAVFADLTAMWLAGFQGVDAPALRKRLLTMHVQTIRKLIPHNETMLPGSRH
jgi:hypothetical protein